MTNYDCVICGKPTRSHKLSEDPDVYVCHECYISRPEDVAKIELELKKIMRDKAEKAAEVVFDTLIAISKAMKGVE